YFVNYEEYARTHPEQAPAGKEPLEWGLPEPFTYPTDVTPSLAKWAQGNDRALDQIVEATRRPRFFIPIFAGQRTAPLLETQLRHLKPLKEAGAALQARALIRLAAGDA